MNELHIDSVTKSYGGKVILSDVYLSCLPGERVGVLGRNGAGKSTLFDIIFGIDRRAQRFVRVGDTLIRSVSDTRGRIGYLPQGGFLPKGLKVKTCITGFLPGPLAGILLEHPLITPHRDKGTNQLSTGERRLIEVMLIVFAPSAYVLLDEPFNGLSPIVRDEVTGVLMAQKARKGILIADHDYTQVLKIADRLVLLDRGCTKPVRDRRELVDLGYLTPEQYGRLA